MQSSAFLDDPTFDSSVPQVRTDAVVHHFDNEIVGMVVDHSRAGIPRSGSGAGTSNARRHRFCGRSHRRRARGSRHPEGGRT